MQEISVFWLRVAILFYLPGLLYAILQMLRRRETLFRPALGFFAVGAVLHLVSLVDLARQTGRFPAETFFETISFCAFVLACLLLFVQWRYKFESLSVFLFPLVFLMAIVGASSVSVTGWTDLRVRDVWLLIHVTSVIGGYAALLIATAVSVFYLIQERRLKAKQMSQRLPPLATLDNLLSRSMAFGFVLFTLAIVTGGVWASVESGTRWILDPRIVVAWATWLAYLVVIYLRVGAGWRGRRAAFMTLSVLAISVVTWAAHVGIRGEFLRP